MRVPINRDHKVLQMPTQSEPIRVLIVDDSTYVRMVLARMLGSARGISVVGQARDGVEAIALAEELRPDVITLDVEMPGLTGLEVLERLLPAHPIPVVMLSSLTHRGAEVTMRALQLGAVDFIGKPGSAGVPDLEAVRNQLLVKIRDAASANVSVPAPGAAPTAPVASIRRGTVHRVPTVLIAASTGGPQTLHTLFASLPPGLPAAWAVTQHMPPSFTTSLAARLASVSAIPFREASDGDVLSAGEGLLARGDTHMIIGPQGVVHTARSEPIWGCRPAADPMMASAAANLTGPLIGVVLTGMGSDGAEGLRRIKQAGGVAVAQDKHTSIIYGMPKAAAQTGVCDHILPLSDIPTHLVEIINDLATRKSPEQQRDEGAERRAV